MQPHNKKPRPIRRGFFVYVCSSSVVGGLLLQYLSYRRGKKEQ